MTLLNAQAPDDGYGHRPMEWIDTVYVHHDAIPISSLDPADERAHIQLVRAYHRVTRVYPDIAYAICIFPSGRVYLTGALETVRWHCAGTDDPSTPQVVSTYNEHGIGLCFAGLFVDGAEPTAEAIAGARAAIRWCEEQVGRKLGVIGHQEVYATTCPGDTFSAWRSQLMEESAMNATELKEALDEVWAVKEELAAASALFPSLAGQAERLFLAVVRAKIATGLQPPT